jgi:hypothetical protein
VGKHGSSGDGVAIGATVVVLAGAALVWRSKRRRSSTNGSMRAGLLGNSIQGGDGGGAALPVPGQFYQPPQPQPPQPQAVELVSSGEGERGRVRLGTILAAGQRKNDPSALIGERVRVFDGKAGEREGTVVDVHSTFGGSTTHAIVFEGGDGTPEPTLLQKGSDTSKGLRFHVLEKDAARASVDDTSWRRPVASIASIRTSNVAKYSVGQYVQNMGASGVSGRVVSAVSDSGTSGPGLLTVDPSGASQPPVNPLAAH